MNTQRLMKTRQIKGADPNILAQLNGLGEVRLTCKTFLLRIYVYTYIVYRITDGYEDYIIDVLV